MLTSNTSAWRCKDAHDEWKTDSWYHDCPRDLFCDVAPFVFRSRPGLTIARRSRSVGGGPYVVALHQIVGAAVVDREAVVGVAGDDVAVGRVGAADGVAIGLDRNAPSVA